MREYYRHPEATVAALQDGWYGTGNIARREADGHYVMVDRPNHLIMRGGLAVCRRVVEEALLRRTVRGPAPACMRSPRSSPRRRRRGAAALATAVVVKLARVIMLAPLVATAAFLARRCTKVDPESGSRRPPLVPLFVMGFLIMVVVRSTGILPQQVLDVAGDRGSRLRRSVCWPSAPAEPSATRDADQPRRATSCRPPIVGDVWMQIRFVFDHKHEDDQLRYALPAQGRTG